VVTPRTAVGSGAAYREALASRGGAVSAAERKHSCTWTAMRRWCPLSCMRIARVCEGAYGGVSKSSRQFRRGVTTAPGAVCNDTTRLSAGREPNVQGARDTHRLPREEWLV
jgi:hypothetical protein